MGHVEELALALGEKEEQLYTLVEDVCAVVGDSSLVTAMDVRKALCKALARIEPAIAQCRCHDA